MPDRDNLGFKMAHLKNATGCLGDGATLAECERYEELLVDAGTILQRVIDRIDRPHQEAHPGPWQLS